MFYSSIYWQVHNPNWRIPSFFRRYTTSSSSWHDGIGIPMIGEFFMAQVLLLGSKGSDFDRNHILQLCEAIRKLVENLGGVFFFKNKIEQTLLLDDGSTAWLVVSDGLFLEPQEHILPASEIGVIGGSSFLISYLMSKVLFLPFEGAKLLSHVVLWVIWRIPASSFDIPTVYGFERYRLQFGHMR